jgi:CheY-like chemotaxis protein
LPLTRLTAPYGRQVILLAERDVAFRGFIRSLLQEEGYEVLVASNGNEALELSRAHRGTIDLFLTDASTRPVINGIVAYRQLSRERPNVKVLFMFEGKGPPTLPEPWPCVPKPFAPEIFRRKINQVLALGLPLRKSNKFVVLVVDSQSRRREDSTNILSENGYAVLTANTAQEATTFAEGVAKIDLIISEIVFLPGVGGVHAEHVEVSGRSNSTLLISYFDRDILRDVRGFLRQAEFLPNPFTVEALLARVRRLLDGVAANVAHSEP